MLLKTFLKQEKHHNTKNATARCFYSSLMNSKGLRKAVKTQNETSSFFGLSEINHTCKVGTAKSFLGKKTGTELLAGVYMY